MSRVLAPEDFYQVGGTLPADTQSYVQRQADQELLAHAAAGDFCYILTPRQMGKSSLIAHTVAQLKKKRLRSVVLDMQGKTERGMTEPVKRSLVGKSRSLCSCSSSRVSQPSAIPRST